MKKNTNSKNVKKRKNKTALKKRKKTIQLLLIIVLVTIVLTLLISEYIRNMLQSSSNTNTTHSTQPLENENVKEKEKASETESEEKDEIADTETHTQDTLEKIQQPPESDTKDTAENTTSTQPPESDTMETSVYFIKIVGETQLQPVQYTRSIPFTLSVLTATLEQLLLGPNNDEKTTGAKSFIPTQTNIRNIYIENNTVFLDLSDEFQFNPFGRLGVLAQLFQIVYTCTEFQTIDTVQILVEGNKRRFLSGDSGSISIDRPLSRTILLEYAENI